jgi:hypothetical protein
MRAFRSILFCLIVLSTGSAYAQFPYTESFKRSTAPGITFGGSPVSAFLTADAIAAAAHGMSVADPDGSGYLRLTDMSTNQTGYVINSTRFPSRNGIHVEFEYYTYGGANIPFNADGITLFLFDADAPAFNIGAFGGSLGYAQKHDPPNNVFDLPGISRGFLGIGLDEFGNFANSLEGRQGGSSAPPVSTSAF